MHERLMSIAKYLANDMRAGSQGCAYVCIGPSLQQRDMLSKLVCDDLQPAVVFNVPADHDGASLISVEEVRAIRSHISHTTFGGGRRLVVCMHAELLSEEAGNALLKCVEEPPSETFFLFGCKNESAMLKTILSRCLRIRLPLTSLLHHDECIGLCTNWQALLDAPLWERLTSPKLMPIDGERLEQCLHHLLSHGQNAPEGIIAFVDELRELYRMRSLMASKTFADRLILSLP